MALDTLTSTQPTLAVLAFQSRTPVKPPNGTSPSANPSTLYCSQLGGTCAADTPTSYLPMTSQHVGWWTHKNGSWYGINDFCVFADGSAMDTWTLEYHAALNNMGNNIKFAYKSPVALGAYVILT